MRRRGLLALALVACLLASGQAAARALQDGRRARRPFWEPDRVLAHERAAQAEVRALVQFDVDPDDPEDPAAKDVLGLQDAFLAFLDKKREGRVEPFQRFRRRPFLGLKVTRKDLARLEDNGNRIEFGGRRVRVRVERTPTLLPSATGSTSSTPVAALLEALGDGALSESGLGSVLIVIDSGVDPTSGALHGEVIDGSQIEGASPTCEVAVEGDDPARGADDSPIPTQPSHGTRVAGLCSAIAPGATLVSIRVGDASGAATTDVIAALQEVACRWSTEHPGVAAVVLTLTSTGVSDEDYPSHRALMDDAIRELMGVGIPVVISAGNDSFTGELAFPADLESSVSVGGLARNIDERLTASNWDESLDLCAPAAAVGLPVAWMEIPLGVGGTSFSPPFVAGVLARLRERYPDGSVFDDFLPVLRDSGVPIEVAEEGRTLTVPRIDIASAVAILDASFLSVETSDETDSESPGPTDSRSWAPPRDAGESAADCTCCDGQERWWDGAPRRRPLREFSRRSPSASGVEPALAPGRQGWPCCDPVDPDHHAPGR